MNINHRAMTGDIIGIVFSNFSNMNVCCMFSLESHGGDYTKNTIINIEKKVT